MKPVTKCCSLSLPCHLQVVFEVCRKVKQEGKQVIHIDDYSSLITVWAPLFISCVYQYIHIILSPGFAYRVVLTGPLTAHPMFTILVYVHLCVCVSVTFVCIVVSDIYNGHTLQIHMYIV